MVNHFYTLLANISGPRVPFERGGKQFYIPEYTQKEVPASLKYVEHALFGDCADTNAILDKACSITILVSRSDLAHVLVEQDPRTTYKEFYQFPNVSCGTSLATTIQSLDNCPESILTHLFKDNQDLKEIYDLGTCVDVLAAVACAYVRYMGGV